MYPVIHIDDEVYGAPEQLGSKRKFWYEDAENKKVLFKEGRQGTGENWAEKVACELCRCLGLPHAEYDLATWRGRQGVVTESFVPKLGRLVFANEVLGKFVEDYDATRYYRQSQHTIHRALALTEILADEFRLQTPIGWTNNAQISPAGVFAGYLLLDAWIGNTDRHAQNWGFVINSEPVAGDTVENTIHLAPTFDHASSMGRNESDKNRLDRMNTRDKRRDTESYAKKARSAFYHKPTHSKPISTMDVIQLAAMVRSNDMKVWLERLRLVSMRHVDAVFQEIPRSFISDPAISFAQQILELNRVRLLHFGESLS